VTRTGVEQRARAKKLAETRRLRAQRVLPTHSARNELDWRLICRAAAVAFLVGAALIHAVWMVIHLQEWAWAGNFFLLLALTESALALALIVIPGPRTYVAAIVVSLGTVVVWAVSRTVGMPIGPEAGLPEPVGAPDLMATLFELLTAATLAPLAFTSPDGPSRRGGARGGALTYWAMIGVGFYTLGLTALAVVPTAAGHEQDSISAPTNIAIPADGHGAHGSESPDRGAASIHLEAREMSFTNSRLSMAARRRVGVHLQNLDDTAHNFSVYRDERFVENVFKGNTTAGDSSMTYRFRSPAPGRYWFRCDLHPFMNGEISFS
jgi:plastocyanin